MVPSNFSGFLLLIIMTLLILQKRVNAEEDSSGFHGNERDALLALKASFNNSFLDTNWTGIMCYMNEKTYWYGIQCFNGRVTGIILENMKLTGEIKEDALVNLTELSNLSLKNNLITGNLMDFDYNPKLRKIDLSSNKFHGEIPPSLLYINSLEALLLQNNDLTGPIPGFNQSSLKSFNVSHNILSGKIPETKTLQSFGFSSYAGNENLCGPPTPTLCNARNYLSESNSENLWPKDEEHDSTIADRAIEKKAIEKRTPEAERGRLVFVENNQPRFELDDRELGGRGTRDRIPFRWSSRLAVARGVARALEYLHQNTRSQTTAPHGNLKSSNVLLDENEETLVSDYGLTSLIALPIAAQRMVAYKTPEYQSHKLISKKSDVWSYGCLLLELLTGRIPAHSAPPGINGVDLCGWVHRAVREEWTAEIFDPEIAVVRGANQGMLRLMQIAMKCCEKSPEKRPDIRYVLAEVEKVRVSVDSEEEELSHSSLDRSLTDDSLSATSTAMVVIADNRR